MKVRDLVAQLRPFLEVAPEAEIFVQVISGRGAHTVVPVAVDRATGSHDIHVIAHTHGLEEFIERKRKQEKVT